MMMIIVELSVEKLLNRSNTPINLQEKIEIALQIYSNSSRSLFNKLGYQLELDACIRWCSLLMEQNDIRVCDHNCLCIVSICSHRNIEILSLNISIGSVS